MEAVSDEELDAEMRKREEEFRKRKEEIRQLKELKKSKCRRKSPQNENQPDIQSTSTQGTVSNSALPSNPDPPQQFKTYKKLAGTIDHGREYEQAMCAYYALKLTISQDVKWFEMTTNNAEDGKFDDFGVTITYKDGSVQKVLMQLKHNKNRTVHISDLRSAKGDFSLKKYSDSISRMSVNIETTFFLFTNSATSIKGNVQINEDVSVEQCTHWQFKDVLASTNEEDVIFEVKSKKFQQKFFFLTRQMDVKKAADAVNTTLKDLLRCDNIHGSFFSYIKTWWAGKFVLTKHDVIAKITELALSPYVKPLTDANWNRKTDSLKQTIMSFPLTLVEGSDEDIVQNIWNGELSWTEEQFSKAREKYGVKERSTILWHLGKLPLVVRVDPSNEEIIRHVMKLLRKDIGDKKIVLSGNVTKNDCESWDTLQSLWDVMKKCEASNHCSYIMQNFRVSLQGRGSITLGDLVSGEEDVAKLIGSKDLLKMSQREYLLVGNQKEELPVLHIPRTISPQFVKTETILNLQSSRDRQIILNCDEKFSETLSQNSAIHTMELSEYINGTISKKQENVILLSTISKCTPLQFEEVRKVSQKSNVYLFQHFDEGYCILMSRSGRELQFGTTDIRTEAVKEREIFKYYNTPLHVLCAPPGMGKSTLMRVLYGTCPSDSLAVYVNLISCNSFLAKQPTFEEMFEHFLHVDGMEEHLFKRLQEHFRRKQKLYMFLDGLDEVNSRHVEQIINFVKHMSSEGVNVWVSSRENLREKIGETLNAVPIDIEELEREEQAEYISSKLAKDYREEEIETIKMTVFQSTTLNQSQNLLGVPLQLYIITEMFLRDRQSFENLKERNFFVLTNMYKTFFEGKIKFAYSKLVDENQEQQLGHLKYILQGYELLALKTCLNDQDYQKLNLDANEDKDFLKVLKAEGDKNGIIKTVNQNDEAIFNHQTYAEYFACVWLNKNRSKIGLLRDAIFSEKYENLRLIFDVLLAENSPLHLAVIYKDFEQVKEHIEEVSRKDGGGRSVFHLAFSYGQKYKPDARSFKLRREAPRYAKMIDRLLEEGQGFEEEDDLFDFDCVKYALQSECLYPIERMLGQKLLTFDKVKESLKCYDAEYLMRFTSRCGYPNLLSELIKENRCLPEAEEMLIPAIEGCGDDVCTPPREGNILVVNTIIANYRNVCDSWIITFALETACSGKYFDMLEILIKNDAQCEDGDTILHLLVENCPADYYNEIVDVIKKFNIDVNARNDDGVTALHKAAKTAEPKIVEALMENGADFNVLDTKGRSALHSAAIESGTESTMKLFLDKGMAVDTRDRNGRTPLHLALQSGEHNNIKMLLNNGADPHLEDNEKNDALHHASKSWHPSEDTIELLIEAGVNLNTQNGRGETALQLAYDRGEYGIAKLLLKYGADPHLEDNEKNDALHHASKSGCPSEYTIEILIEAVVNIKAQDRSGETASHLASNNGHESEVVKLLLKYRAGPHLEDDEKNNASHRPLRSRRLSKDTIEILIRANVNTQNKSGETTLHWALNEGISEVMNEFWKYGAEPHLEDNEENNAFHHPLRSRRVSKDTIELLIEACVNLNAQSERGETALNEGISEVVSLFWKNGADPHLEDDEENNAFRHALRSRRLFKDTIEILIQSGVNVNAQNKSGETALHLALNKGESEVVELLLKYGADPHLEDNEKNNAFHHASKSGCPSEDTIKNLIEADVNINAQNESGETALHLASNNGHGSESVKLLLKYGADPHLEDNEKNNALHRALRSRCLCKDTIEILLEAGVNVNAQNKSGETALHLASNNEDGSEAVKLLLKYGADPHLEDNEKNNALHRVLRSRCLCKDTIEILIEAGVDVNAQNKRRETALRLALNRGISEVVNLFFKYDPNLKE